MGVVTLASVAICIAALDLCLEAFVALLIHLYFTMEERDAEDEDNGRDDRS